MSNYRDEHGAPVDWNPALRGGPGSTGEALFRTHMVELAVIMNQTLDRIAATLEIDLEPVTRPTHSAPVVRPPEFVLCNHESVIHVGGIVHGGPCDEQS